MNKKFLYRSAAFLSLLLQYNSLWSQEDSLLGKYSLKDLLNVKVVTATKVSQGLQMAPATIVVVTRDQIKMRGYQSLLDVMYDLPDVKVDDKIYSGIRNSFTIRGTQGAEKFVILLDGISISSPSGEAMPIMENYPVHLAEQIEVVYGPASALYGANAVSGVINIITRKPSARKDMSIDISTSGGTYGYTNSTLLMSKRLGANATLVVSGQYFYDKGVDYSRLYKNDSLFSIASYATGTINTILGPFTPSTPVRPVYEAPMEAYNLYAAMNTGHFSVGMFRNSFTTPSAFGNNTSNAVFNKDAFMKQSITTANASYKRTFDKISSATSFILSQYTLDPQSNYRNLFTGMEPGYKYSMNSMFKVEQHIGYQSSDKLNFLAGASYENYVAIPQSADLSAPVEKNHHVFGSYKGTEAYYRPEGLPAQFYFIRFYNVGSYLQTQYSLSKKVHFTLGSRYDVNSRYGNTFNPRLGMVYKPSEGNTFKILYGQAFLAPVLSDAYSQWGSFNTTDSGRTYTSSFLHLPNHHLKPIVSKNAEVSFNKQITDNLVLDAAAFYTFMRGLLVFSDDNATTRYYNNMFNGVPVDYIQVFTNNDRQKTYGGNIRLNWKHEIGKLYLNSYAIVSYVNGIVDDGLRERNQMVPDKELDFISHLMYRFGVEGKLNKLTFSSRLLLLSDQHIAGISDTTTSIHKRQVIPGYALLNISLRYGIGNKLSAFTNISNALNQKYRAVGYNMDLNVRNTDFHYGQPQDPIRITVGLNCSF